VTTPDREAREKALGRIQTLVRANFGQGLLIVPDALDTCGMPYLRKIALGCSQVVADGLQATVDDAYYREDAEAEPDESDDEDA
jgi:hypothetical protein